MHGCCCLLIEMLRYLKLALFFFFFVQNFVDKGIERRHPFPPGQRISSLSTTYIPVMNLVNP